VSARIASIEIAHALVNQKAGGPVLALFFSPEC